MTYFGMMIGVFVLAARLLIGAAATTSQLMIGAAATASPQAHDEFDPPAPGDITEVVRGVTRGVVESSYDHHPQIDRLVNVPRPKIIPINKLPIDPTQREGFKPAPRKYASFSGLSNTGWVPPDCCLAVGPSHVMQTVNQSIAWYDKAGALQFSSVLDDSGNPGFFEGVGAKSFTFDPKCFYDDVNGRFVVMALEQYASPQEAWICLALSDDNDPNGTWYKYRTDALTVSGGSNHWVDYPGFGYDNRAYYVTGNVFDFGSGLLLGTKYRIFDKTPILSGGAATWADLLDTGAASVQVAECHTNPRNPLFVSTNTNTSVKVQAIKTVLTSPALTTTTVTVPFYKAPPGSPNLGGGALDVLDGRFINSEFGAGKLVASHGIDAGGGRCVARWYQFNTNNWPAPGTTVTLDQSGGVAMGAGIHTFYPAVCRKTNGDIALCFGISSLNEYASVGIAVHRTTDAAGTLGVIERVFLGSSGATGRWGDYFDCCLDPGDSTKFWGVGEYPNWGTWIAEFDSTHDVPTTGLLYSTRAFASVGGIAFDPGDIVHLDTTTGVTSLYFDVSDVLGAPLPNVDAFAVLATGEIMISFADTVTIAGLVGGPSGNTVEDEDLVLFTPTKLGEVTAGSWTFHFDGSDVALNTTGEDIDALAVDASGNLYVSFEGAWDVGGGMTGFDEDMLQFTPTTTGSTTSGTWSWLINGQDVDIKLGQVGEDTDALDYDVAAAKITISTDGNFQVPVNVTGERRDLATFTATALGFNPAGTWAFYFDGDSFGLANDDVDGIEILP